MTLPNLALNLEPFWPPCCLLSELYEERPDSAFYSLLLVWILFPERTDYCLFTIGLKKFQELAFDFMVEI